MKLTGMKGGEVYISAADVVRIYSTADQGATEPRTVIICATDRLHQHVREPVAEVITAMEAERATVAAADPTRLALRAVVEGLRAAVKEVVRDDSPSIQAVARMMYSAAWGIETVLEGR